ncbi:MAG TPA: carbonic anhydrase family protein [Gemmatimonadales bacterium]|nr:carbonic anhydrase family protein [Gemmatimonadales bacterium]
MHARSRVLIPGIVLVSIALAPRPLPAQAHQTAHWTYQGETGPAHWGSLDPAFSRCTTGHAQSPLDIRTATSGALPSLAIRYQETRITVLNNGHTIQVNYDPGSTIMVDGITYELIQFHFHTPSEHTISGKPAAAELHLVHRSADGVLAVIGVLVQRGPESAALAPLWKSLPAVEGPAHLVNGRINALDLLPARRTTYRYDGSLTTPPCSEGVKWLVMTSPTTISDQQLASLTEIIHTDSRPVQSLHGRRVTSDAEPQ